MNNPVQNKTISPTEVHYSLSCQNLSSETVPPYGVMEIVGTTTKDNDEAYFVQKPTASGGLGYIVNGPAVCAPQGWCGGGSKFPTVAAWADTFLTPAAGAEWGPVPGSWALNSLGSGFKILGGVTGSLSGTARVAGFGASSGADRLVAASPTDQIPRELSNILAPGAVYDQKLHEEILWSLYLDQDQQKVRGWFLIPREIAIIDGVAKSTWNPNAKPGTPYAGKKTPTPVTAPLFFPHPDDDGTDTIHPTVTWTGTANLNVEILAPATGKFKRGIVFGRKLFVVQCDEEDLPPNWNTL